LYLFVFEFLGTTELMVILVVALVVFGPRKLPQLSRSLGKSLTEFRRASEDFKRTWEREVAMDDVLKDPANPSPPPLPPTVTPSEYSIGRGQSFPSPFEPEISDVSENTQPDPIYVPAATAPADDPVADQPVPAKRDWL
jgi:TatA/E family protein of Tat protein translocase